MKFDGRNRIVYECDNAVKNKTAEGSVHTILNREGLEAMLLDRSMCTKDMEHRVMNALNGIGEWYGPEIRDILYTHGKFRGYVFYKEMEPEPESIPSNPISNEITNSEQNIYDDSDIKSRSVTRERVPESYNTLARAAYLIASLILMAVVTAKVIYPSMLQRAYYTGSDMGSFFETFSINGIMGIGVGVIVSCICGRYLFSKNAVLYYVIVPVVFIVSATLLYLFLQMLIGLASVALSIFAACIPVLIIIAAIAYVLKSMFR